MTNEDRICELDEWIEVLDKQRRTLIAKQTVICDKWSKSNGYFAGMSVDKVVREVRSRKVDYDIIRSAPFLGFDL